MNDSPSLIDRHKLQAARIRARLSGPALAQRAKLSKATVSALERGERGGTPETLGALADALGIDITALMPDGHPAAAKAAA